MNASDKSVYDMIVTGDVVVDHHIYEGERYVPAIEHVRGVRAWRELGGADVVRRLLAELLKDTKDETWRVRLGVTAPAVNETPRGFHAFATWRPFPLARDKKDDKTSAWRAQALMGYGEMESAGPEKNNKKYEPKRAEGLPPPRILVLDEAGYRFRSKSQKDCWLLPEDGEVPPDWIFLKMSRPVAQGDLWHELVTNFSDRLVCLVCADDLRQECVSISSGLSWERTVEETRDVLVSNPVFAGLNRCRHLIVRFRTDGALWVDRSNPDKPLATLIYDAGGAEGEWEDRFEGKVVGHSSVMIAALSYALARHVAAKDGKEKAPDMAAAIEAGLSAARDLQEKGHGLAGNTPPAGFPAQRLANTILKQTSSFARVSTPLRRHGTTPSVPSGTWAIIEMSQRPLDSDALPSLVGLARQVMLQGTGAIKRLPHARFGKLISIDRTEIETLRSIRRLMLNYRDSKSEKKPLSIGVFGPPGAGKSFGVKQLAAEVFGKAAWLEFNLSQFGGAADLIGAFHEVRDFVLSGGTPVVFWDEFDSGEYKYLQYLLAPMQDGRFQEGQLNHAIGKCVFVFAGATSQSFDAFGAPSSPEKEEKFRLLKGPDFKSRLDAYYDVMGPNRRLLPPDGKGPDPGDVGYPLRRAILIRGLLGCKPEERLDFDSDLIDALLLVPKYHHGSRSLEKLILQLKSVDGGSIRRSSLPAVAQLAMHVDPQAFYALLNRNEGFRMSEMIEPLAEGIHETFRALRVKEGWNPQPQFDMPYAQLAEIDKEDNRAAARRIPEILALAGMGIADTSQPVASDEPSKEVVSAHLEHHLERLAEAEHDGWMEQRFKNGWQPGEPRDDAKKIHPLLVPYAGLPEKEKNKDRNSVRQLPAMIARAGYRIVWLKQPGT